MKKERLQELFADIQERELTLTDCAELFSTIAWFIERQRDWMDSIGKDHEKDAEESFLYAKHDLIGLLYDCELNYTTDEFITED